MKKIWIVGSQGRIGRALLKLLDTTEYEVLETDLDEVDIADQKQVAKYMMIHRPEVVVNCAGYHVRAEGIADNQDADNAYRVNAVGARNLAQTAEEIQAKLIQLSTDDVFSQPSEVPYTEFDEVAPIDVYGKSKYAGERFVRELMNRYVIIRSSWVYGIGRDFMDEVLAAARDEGVQTLELKDNAYAVPTSATELAKIIKLFVDEEHYGIYHAVCSGGWCSRLEFAKEILKQAGLEEKLQLTVREGVASKFSVLDNMMLRITGLPIPGDWKEVLAAYIQETGGQE